MSELDEILAQQSALQSAGQGHFTVDPKRQRELLARLGLQNTSQGFLKLCQGIYRTRPSEIHFHSQANLVHITFRPTLDLPTPLWDSAPMGLAVLSLSQEYQIQWKGKYRGTAGPEAFEEEEEEDASAYQGRVDIQISRPHQHWWHRDWTPAIETLLERKLRWMLCPWTWNDCAAPPPPVLSYLAEALVLAEQGSGGLRLPTYNRAKMVLLRQANQVGAHCYLEDLGDNQPGLAILGATTGNSWSETFFVLDGVLLEGENNLLDRPGVTAVVSAEGLTPALNGLKLVHDQAFRERLQSLRPEVSWLDSINQRGR